MTINFYNYNIFVFTKLKKSRHYNEFCILFNFAFETTSVR